ncbi:MAG: SAM-dependent methyltransferase [Streptosporangiales bacterium]|nr:SAM-dependent methyltransferase [Streptosporangiales bacterium]
MDTRGRRPHSPLIDMSKPSPARMYDYYLGGKDNYAVDRAAAEDMRRAIPELFQTARENRHFLGRAVRHLCRAGIRQFIDLGAGLPTQGNVNEIAQQETPGARVVCVDNDPIVQAHGEALLGDDEHTTIVAADIREPAEVLGHPELKRLIDLNEPVGVLFVAVLHFIPDTQDPDGVVASFRDAVAPGSYLTIAHGTTAAGSAAVKKMTDTYDRATESVQLREPERIKEFFGDWEMVEPGAVHLPWWHPEIDPRPEPEPTRWHFGGVARKP